MVSSLLPLAYWCTGCSYWYPEFHLDFAGGDVGVQRKGSRCYCYTGMGYTDCGNEEGRPVVQLMGGPSFEYPADALL